MATARRQALSRLSAFEVLPVSRNATLHELTHDVERFVDSAEDDEDLSA